MTVGPFQFFFRIQMLRLPGMLKTIVYAALQPMRHLLFQAGASL
jgi:hypothetical protein